jgi:hypothetical protein
MIAAIYARKSTARPATARVRERRRGNPMSVEMVMTRESFDCLEKLIPNEVSEGLQAPGGLTVRGDRL